MIATVVLIVDDCPQFLYHVPLQYIYYPYRTQDCIFITFYQDNTSFVIAIFTLVVKILS